MAKAKEGMVRCEVLRGIGMPVTEEDKKHLELRAERRGLKFVEEGLTTMIYPRKSVFDEAKKAWIPGKPVFIDLETDVARKLNSVGAVRVVI